MTATTDKARREEWSELVAEQRRQQGFPLKVEDPVVIARVIRIIRAGEVGRR